jgi:hypothetical protein
VKANRLIVIAGWILMILLVLIAVALAMLAGMRAGPIGV